MANGAGKMEARRAAILELLEQNRQVRISELSERFGTSVVTLRSDIDALEQKGLLARTYGGAAAASKSGGETEPADLARGEHYKQKKAIAALACEMVNDGDTLMINSGTTSYLTALALKKHRSLNVVTNSLYVALTLGNVPTFRVILLGGEINAQYHFVYGEDAKLQLTRYKADKAILSVDGICPKAGITTYHAEEGVIDRIMMERSTKTVIVADSSKLGHESFSRVCGLEKAAYWVTDSGADAETAKAVAAFGVEIRCAKEGDGQWRI